MQRAFVILIALVGLQMSLAQRVGKESWSVEFDSPDQLDLFIQETGNHGWGNNEAQMYTTQNAEIANGVLNINVKRDDFFQGQQYKYTSSRLFSKNSFRYGTVEMRAKLPFGRGTWPAFWMLADPRPLNWPLDGEIDIMEHVGYDQNNIHGTIHTGKHNHQINTQLGIDYFVNDVAGTYHTYKLEWSSTQLRWFVDDREFFRYDKEVNAGYDSWPFDNYFNIIVNVAVGGWWGGSQGIDDSIFPQQYVIDYIRYTPSDETTVETDSPNGNNGDRILWNHEITGLQWASACDFVGNDFLNLPALGSSCGPLCEANSRCTHFAWTNFNGGTCFMKEGQVSREEAVFNGNFEVVCGVTAV